MTSSYTQGRVGRSYRWTLTDRLWARFEVVLADPPRRRRYPGRRRYSPRDCLQGVIYVLYTDTPWLQVPYRELGFPSGETCRRRMEEWIRRGVFDHVLAELVKQRQFTGRLHLDRVIVDAMTVDAKKGAPKPVAPSIVALAAASTCPPTRTERRLRSNSRPATKTSVATSSPWPKSCSRWA